MTRMPGISPTILLAAELTATLFSTLSVLAGGILRGAVVSTGAIGAEVTCPVVACPGVIGSGVY